MLYLIAFVLVCTICSYSEDCVGDSASFNAGYGMCSTYAPGGFNNYWCQSDFMPSQGYAFQVCSECGDCTDSPVTEDYQTTDGAFTLIPSQTISGKCCGTSSSAPDMSGSPMANSPSDGCTGGFPFDKQEWIDYGGIKISSFVESGYNGLQLCIDGIVYYYSPSDPIPVNDFTIVSSGYFCEIDSSGCVTDGAGNYGNSEECEIIVNAAGSLSVTEFNVENHSSCNYDSLSVDGMRYCGIDSPNGVQVNEGSILEWRSDSSEVREGWTICLMRENAEPDTIAVDCVMDESATRATCPEICGTVPAVPSKEASNGGAACNDYSCQPGDGTCPLGTLCTSSQNVYTDEATMLQNGWAFYMDMKMFADTDGWSCSASDGWGFKGGQSWGGVGFLTLNLEGSGEGEIEVGYCDYSGGTVRVYLNGNEIASLTYAEQKIIDSTHATGLVVSFTYSSGDVLTVLDEGANSVFGVKNLKTTCSGLFYLTTDGAFTLIPSQTVSDKCCGTSDNAPDMSLWPMANSPSDGCTGGIPDHDKQQWIDYGGAKINNGYDGGPTGLHMCIDGVVYYYSSSPGRRNLISAPRPSPVGRTRLLNLESAWEKVN